MDSEVQASRGVNLNLRFIEAQDLLEFLEIAEVPVFYYDEVKYDYTTVDEIAEKLKNLLRLE